MAITNRDRVEKSLEQLKTGIIPFIEREFKSTFGDESQTKAESYLGYDRHNSGKPLQEWDNSALLKLMWDSWFDVFNTTLGPAERGLVGELRGHRNKWAHESTFSSDDADRVLDSTERLLAAISAPEADEVRKIKMELRRVMWENQNRNEQRKIANTAIEGGATGQLKPWREVVTPHHDVASGRYQQAEFAADLWQVHLDEGADEYRDPEEFFRRTYLTASLKQMLTGAVRRLSGNGGDPVVQLQTNFGGGKTHSMLALLHLFSGANPSKLTGVDEVMNEAEVQSIPKARTVVLVGNKISPGSPSVKGDGTVVRTLWGELAWQLGGKEAFARVATDDEHGTSPGDVLRELFVEYGPCLILVDEWVAYARQLHEQSDLPGGSFETQFTFAQTLTESAKLAQNCLLVVSLPASDTSGSPHTQADDVEVGGARGREALDRLRNVIGRLESSWRPASAEEGFEIVRRRLFQTFTDDAQYKHRDVVARAFADVYRSQKEEFPAEASDGNYEARIKSAYPIHPEIFDRLYKDWSTLVKFQRTRGVLRLMAAVIHSLWEKGDKNPLILPSLIPIDDPRVQFELTRYLSDNWTPIIEKDVDGPNSLPLQIDNNATNLGKIHATRRVARTVYLGSAPLSKVAHRGIEDKQIKLGCAMPGETPAIFGDALRRLAGSATYLYQDEQRYWYSTQPTVTKMADDRAEQIKRDTEKWMRELEERLRKNLQQKGDFDRIHNLPQSGQDVPDEMDTRLVVLSAQYPHSKGSESSAQKEAQKILEYRGNAPRIYRNSLIFLAADTTRLQDLEDALCRYLAWDSILADRQHLNLDPQQVKQAETQLKSADGTVTARLPEIYQWLLVPTQNSPQESQTWQSYKLSGQDALAERASKKLRSEESFVPTFASSSLKMELDRIPLWRGDYVELRQLAEDFARYLYLPRLKNSAVLMNAVRSGLELLTWEKDSFAYADSWDESAERYRGLRGGQSAPFIGNDPVGVLVKPEVARQQMDEESAAATTENTNQTLITATAGTTDSSSTSDGTFTAGAAISKPIESPTPKRFHGAVQLDTTRVGRDAGRIADEVISHLAGLVGADVTVTLEIAANLPSGASEHLVRTVTENCRTLKFTTQGFEQE